MSSITDGLNERQKEAVDTLSGPVLVLAGAGSGKTKVLTHRIANLIQHGVQPQNILAVTFTNKAAREMRERLFRLLQPNIKKDSKIEPPRNFMPYMGTFHGVAVKILRLEAKSAGLDHNFTIYDMDDQITLIKRIMKDLKLGDKKQLKPKAIQSVISSEKNQGNSPEEYKAKSFFPNQRDIAKVFEKYEEEKRNASALDFDDLLLKTLELFAKNADVRKKWQKKFQHILIDEYQDTNTIQYQLVKLLVGKERNICVVGDDWQSIYSWRGADFTNILNFEKDFPGAKVIKLEQNYRSTGNILKASQEIINQNKTRTDKELFTEAGDGEPVEIESLRDETAEATYVAMKILSLKKEYPDYSDFAVLYRTNAQSFTFEKTFIEMHIPYKIVGGVRFYDRKEVKDVLAILKLIVNGRDKVSLERVAHNVLPGVGDASISKLLGAMETLGDETEPLKNPDLPEALNAGKARKSVERLCDFVRKIDAGGNPGEIVKRVVEYFDFKTLTDDGTPNAEERMENLVVLSANAGAYDSLEEFLNDATLMSSADESSEKNSVTLMTMHSAKGLEFPVVFMVGMEDGLFPSARSSDEEDALEEERRLAYVGMTRAMRRLFMTYATSRFSFGSRNYNMPSRFLMEIGYNPYGSSGYKDEDGDGFMDFTSDSSDGFGEDDFDSFDPFPEDVPVFE
ncbi:UvrD-helicase domain-containing protein [Candidatus Saccharibacteria bacterium]|nr:UvrD-helicase domain-containing protein [Candidatus Saccharibacteria bacterium]